MNDIVRSLVRPLLADSVHDLINPLGGAGLDPTVLFEASDWGDFFYFNDHSLLKQDSGGTGDVGDGDPVGFAQGARSSGGFNITQGTAAKKFTARSGYCEFATEDLLFKFSEAYSATSVVFGTAMRFNTHVSGAMYLYEGQGFCQYRTNNKFRQNMLNSLIVEDSNTYSFLGDGQYHRVIFTADAATDRQRIYVDGVLSYDTSIGGNVGPVANMDFYFTGNGTNAGGFDGYAAAAFVRANASNREMTDDEITTLDEILQGAIP